MYSFSFSYEESIKFIKFIKFYSEYDTRSEDILVLVTLHNSNE